MRKDTLKDLQPLRLVGSRIKNVGTYDDWLGIRNVCFEFEDGSMLDFGGSYSGSCHDESYVTAGWLTEREMEFAVEEFEWIVARAEKAPG